MKQLAVSVRIRSFLLTVIRRKVVWSHQDIECYLLDLVSKPSVLAGVFLTDLDSRGLGYELIYAWRGRRSDGALLRQVSEIAEAYSASGVYVAIPRFCGTPQPPSTDDLRDYEDLQVVLSQSGRTLEDILIMDSGQIINVKVWWKYTHGSAAVRAFGRTNRKEIELRQCFCCGVYRESTDANNICSSCDESIAPLKASSSPESSPDDIPDSLPLASSR